MITCRKCNDLGIVRVFNKEQELHSLCTCTCEWASMPVVKLWKLPIVNRKIEQAFTVMPCPLDWFLPDNERGSVPKGQLMPSVQKIAEKWRMRISDAHKFWAQWGTIFDEQKHHMEGR